MPPTLDWAEEGRYCASAKCARLHLGKSDGALSYPLGTDQWSYVFVARRSSLTEQMGRSPREEI